MILDKLNNNKINPVVVELFTRGRKLNVFVFVTQSCFAVPKNIRLNFRHFIIKISNKWELKQITFNHLSDIDFQDFMNLYKNVL